MIVDESSVGASRNGRSLVPPDYDEALKRLMLELQEAERSLPFGHPSPSTLEDLSKAVRRLRAMIDTLAKPATGKQCAKAPSLRERFLATAHSVTLFSLRTFRVVLGFSLWILVLGFLILFGLQFLPHPVKWDSWAWVVELRNTARPLLSLIDSVLKWPAAVPFYPIAVAFVCLVVQIFTDSKLAGLCQRLDKKHPGRAAVEMEDRKRAIPFGGGPSSVHCQQLIDTPGPPGE